MIARRAERLFLRLGVRTGVDRIKALLPAASRARLRILIKRLRERRERRSKLLVRELTWTRATRVWAADFSDVPTLIDGVFPYALHVRDLGSHRRLACVPASRKTSRFARRVLESLFDRLGAPLVFKTDNGPEFKGEVTTLLQSRRVVALKGPGRTPRFNGSIEASIGWIEAWTLEASARDGRADRWTSESIEAARVLAERTVRPWGCRGPTPLQAWRRERRILRTERAAFIRLASRCGVEAALRTRELLSYRSRWVRKAPWMRRNG